MKERQQARGIDSDDRAGVSVLREDEVYIGLPMMMVGGSVPREALVPRSRNWLQRGFDAVGRAFAPVGRFVSGLMSSGRQPDGPVSAQFMDYTTDDAVDLGEIVVTGYRNARRGVSDVIENAYLTYVRPAQARIVDTAQAIGGGIRDLYLPNPANGRTALPTGYADAMGNYYPGTGPLPGNDYNPIAHPWTTAGMAAGVVAAPYAMIGGGTAITAALARPVLTTELTITAAEIAAGDAIGGGTLAAVGAGGVYVAGKLAEPAAEFVGPLIGKSGFRTTTEPADEVGRRYQTSVDDAYERAVQAEARGALLGHPDFRVGNATDRFAARELNTWLDTEGISEGPTGMVQINRWLRDPQPTGLYGRPDVRVPGARAIYDATTGVKFGTPQINRFQQFSNGDRITIVRPQTMNGNVVGSYSILP